MINYYEINFKDEEYNKVENYLKDIKDVVIVNSGFCIGFLSKDQKGVLLLSTTRDNLSGSVSIDKDFPNSNKIKKDITKLLKEKK